MASTSDEHSVWCQGVFECVMISRCAGAELQLRRVGSDSSHDIVLRELYPTKSDLYERARMLKREYLLA